MMPENERIDLLIKQLEGGSSINFSKTTGIDPSSVSHMLNGKLSIGLRGQKILAAYPSVNRKWLETGEGDPGDLSIEVVKIRYERKLAEKEVIIRNLSEAIAKLAGREQ